MEMVLNRWIYLLSTWIYLGNLLGSLFTVLFWAMLNKLIGVMMARMVNLMCHQVWDIFRTVIG